MSFMQVRGAYGNILGWFGHTVRAFNLQAVNLHTGANGGKKRIKDPQDMGGYAVSTSTNSLCRNCTGQGKSPEICPACVRCREPHGVCQTTFRNATPFVSVTLSPPTAFEVKREPRTVRHQMRGSLPALTS